MKLACMALEPGGGMRPEAEAAAVAGWRAGAGPYWIDIRGGPAEAVTAWLAGLGLDSQMLDLMEIGDGDTRFVPLAEAVYLSYPVLTGDDAGEPGHFGYLCLDRLVITMHDEPGDASVLDQAPAWRLKLPGATTAAVVCTLALVHASRLRRRVLTLRREGNALADRMDAEPRAVSLAEILALKHRVQALGGVVQEELAVFEVMKVVDKPALPMGPLAGPLQIAIETVRAADRDIDRLDRRVADLQQRYDSAQQDQVNRRLALLTVISAIFLPLTLIAGIYGMNFDVMPELHYRYSYPVALGAMALIAGGLHWYFRSRWWPK